MVKPCKTNETVKSYILGVLGIGKHEKISKTHKNHKNYPFWWPSGPEKVPLSGPEKVPLSGPEKTEKKFPGPEKAEKVPLSGPEKYKNLKKFHPERVAF